MTTVVNTHSITDRVIFNLGKSAVAAFKFRGRIDDKATIGKSNHPHTMP